MKGEGGGGSEAGSKWRRIWAHRDWFLDAEVRVIVPPRGREHTGSSDERD